MDLHYFVIISPWKWALNPDNQGCFVTSLVEIGTVVLEKNIFKSLLFRNHLTSKMGVALHLNKRESPSAQDALFQI